MLEPKRINSNIAPSIIENLGNGNWYYNYDIQSEKVEVFARGVSEENNIQEEIRYNYIQIKLPQKPEYKKCVESIIREFITQTQEFDLINSANKDLLSGVEASNNIIKYKEYLDKIEEIKENVAKDLGK